MSNNHMETREAWLMASFPYFAELFTDAGFSMPENIRVSCGFPSIKAMPGKTAHRIGECWYQQASSDGHFEIFISPLLDDPVTVLDILSHEICHTVAGPAAGHGKDFGKVARKIGLEGKLTATFAGEGLRKQLSDIVTRLGAYPHGKLNAMTNGKKKQTTRMIKAECEACGYTVRLSRKWLDEVGIPHCPNHGEMYCEGVESADDGE